MDTHEQQKTIFEDLECLSVKIRETPRLPTFEINGQGTPVSCHYNVIHISSVNLLNLRNLKPIQIHQSN